MKTKKRLLSVLLSLALVLGLMPGMSLTAYAAGTELTTTTTTWETGSYEVPANGVTIANHITVNGIVNLTLTESATLTANTGITLSDGATLNVSGEGAMVVKGSNGNANSTVAGTGTLVLTSGTLAVTGGTAANVAQYGTSSNAGGVAVNGSVTVNGGILNATGGVGGSLSSYTVRARAGAGGTAISGNVTVNAGTVTATGGNGGSDAAYASGARAGDGGVAIGGDATINGGTWAATYGSAGAKGPSEDGRSADGTVGAGGASYNGTLTLGANVKLYEGTEANEEKLLDGNDSDSRVYSGEKKASMYAYGPDISQGPDKTALNDAITAAETLYNSIKDNTDYTDITNTFQTAINTAKGVADGDEVDQDAVDTATSNIITANTNAVIGIINALPAANGVTMDDKTVIEAVRAAYDALDDTQKALVDADTLKKLTDAEAALKAVIDTAAANTVSETINALKDADEVTIADKTDIEAARAAYEALTDDQKAKVSADTLKKLTDAEDALAVAEVSATITDLPAADNVTTADKATIEAARAAYDALTDAQKEKVSADTLEKLTAAEDALAAVEVSATINTLPAADNVTTADKATIEAARAAYDALTDAQKEKVSADTLEKLTAAEDALAVADVNEKINTLPAADNVTTADKATIEAARAAYDALTDAQKEKVSADTLEKLTAAEDALAVADVNEKINTLPAADNVTTADKATIEAARAAYDALTDAQKEKVSADTLEKLTAAEDALAVADVNEKINTLPAADNVTTADKATIEAARAAYDALTDDEKAKVSADTLKKLTDAEEKLVVLQVMSEVSAKTGSGMTYTGNPIQLINTPTTSLPDGYTMKYAVTTENTAPTDDNLYTTSIPAKTDVGTYYVWYKAVGDEDHSDSKPACITVTISKPAEAPAPADEEKGEADFKPSAAAPDVKGVKQEAIKTQMEELAKADDTKLKAGQVKEVTVNMETKAVAESDVPKKEASAIKETAEGMIPAKDRESTKCDFLDIAVSKIVIVYDVKNGKKVKNESNSISTNLTNLAQVIDIPVKYDLTGKFNPLIVRYHNGKADAFRRLYAAPAKEALKDGTYYVEGTGKNAIVHIYTNRFSTYALLTSGTEEYPRLGDSVTVYRLYYGPTMEHFYTTSAYERRVLIDKYGWVDEGIAWKSPKAPTTDEEKKTIKPVYRLFNPFTTDHHYTKDANERKTLIDKYGWKDEGIAFYSNDKGDATVYRLWHPGLITGAHHFTTSKYEYDVLVSRGWVGENAAFKVNAEG